MVVSNEFYVILHHIPMPSEPLHMLLGIPQAPEILGSNSDPTPHVYHSVNLQLDFVSNHVSTPLRDARAKAPWSIKMGNIASLRLQSNLAFLLNQKTMLRQHARR